MKKTDTSNTANTAKLIYDTKIEEINAKLKAFEASNQRFSSIRLGIFICIIATAGLSLLGGFFSAWWILVPIFTFALLVIRHDKVIRQIEQTTWSRDFYEESMRRITNDWQGKGNTQTHYIDDGHLYAKDLDIFGEGSLFELMCSAKTTSGEQQLASWLTTASNKKDIIERQNAIQELTQHLQLREDIYLCTRKMQSLINPQKLSQWATASHQISPGLSKSLRFLFVFCGVAAIGAIVSCFFSDYGIGILAAIGIIEWIIGRLLKDKISPIIHGVEGPKRQLKVLSDILHRFEQQSVQCELLTHLQQELLVQDHRASQSVAHLGKLVDWLDQAKNQVFAPIGFLLMWNGHFALSIEKWRAVYGTHIDGWIKAAGKLEALCAIAGYAFEHPTDPYPVIREGAPFVQGSQLGHPLIERDACVRNKVILDTNTQVWIVSGSNMSGKSTFLRVVGINAVLAMCGAPICGDAMELTPVSIGSTIRVLDSLQKGTSRFYAEISTLKQIVELIDGKFPLLFLLDEIFHGTNSHDRKIGAHAVVKELVERGAIGMVTTHDLALTKSAEQLDGKAKNVHFEDTVKDGLLSFDYTLKEGPVTKSNALELMRSVGLNV